MRTAILLATPLLLLAGCKIDAGTTTITNVSIDGKAQNVMRSYVNGGARDFECIKSVSGRCHYLLFVRDCDASAPADTAQPCATRPGQSFTRDGSTPRHKANLPPSLKQSFSHHREPPHTEVL